MRTTALIMAGGRGERFWPKSRKSLPKQFLSLTDDGRTMIQLTVERISPLVNIEDIFIGTNENYKALVKAQLPDLPEENILCEVVGRNTAPAIGLGAAHIQKKYGDAAMLVLPSDHLIKNNALFVQTLREAVAVAQKGENLVTIGITPEHPETGYGYIKFNSNKTDAENANAFEVERFVEKPNLEKAKEYLESGDYLWNSGMFIWKTSTIMARLKDFLPETYAGLEKIAAAIGQANYDEVLDKEFRAFSSESIDYGVMEHAKNIYTLPGSFGWDDVGSWLALGRHKHTNQDNSVVDGNVVAIGCHDNIIQGGKKLIAAVGIKDLIVVDTDDAILICQKENAGDIKKVLENLRNNKREEYI